MRQLRALADVGVLDLDEVVDLDALEEMRVRAQVDELAELDIVVDLAFVRVDELARHAVAALDVLEADIRSNLAFLADDRAMLEPGHRVDDGIAADLDVVIDVRRRRVHDGDALAHELFILAAAQDLLGAGELQARVDAERVLVVVSGHGPDLLAFLLEDLEHVRQVVLALRVVVRHVRERLEEVLGGEAVDARVDLADLALRLRRVLVLDDLLDRAVRRADDAAVARRIRHDGREDRRLGSGCHMLIVEFLEERARQERRVAAEDHDRARLILEEFLRLQDGVARAELLRLRDELRLITDGLADHLAAEARHDDVALRTGRLGRIDDVLQHRLAARLVQDLRQLRLHARALAGREDDGY